MTPQTVPPQKETPKPQTSGAASGGQTAGAGQTAPAAGGIAGLGTGATIAIVAGVALVVVAAANSSTSH